MKVVKHAHHGTIFRLPNEDAHLLVSSGRYVYSSKFEARQAAQRPARPLWLRIGLFVTTLAMIVAALLLSTSAKAADKPVPKLTPYKVCLSQAQAAQVYKGKRLKYREVAGERCWYAGSRLPKHAFIHSRTPAVGTWAPERSAALRTSAVRPNVIGWQNDESRPVVTAGETASNPRATGVAVTPARPSTQEPARVQAASDGSIPSAGTSFTDTLIEDAFLALTGKPESSWTFDAYWNLMTGWSR
jgi:hypothetical protein